MPTITGRRSARGTTKTQPRPKGLVRRLLRAVVAMCAFYLFVAYVTERSTFISGVGGSGGPPNVPTEGDPVLAVSSSSQTLSGVLHVHTEISHDAIGTTPEVADAARHRALDFVLVSDHRYETGTPLERPRWEDDVLLIFGQERGLDQNNGRLLLQGIDTVVSLGAGTEEVRALASRPGATLVIAHPRGPGRGNTWRPEDTGGAHAWELFNLEDGLLPSLSTWRAPAHLIGILGGAPFGRGSASLLRAYDRGALDAAAAAFDSAYAKSPLTAVGAINAHPKTRIGSRLVPSYELSMGTLVNHVQVSGDLPEDAEVAAETVMTAIRGGRVYISFGGSGDARAFKMGVARSGTLLGGMGDTVDFDGPLEMEAHFGSETPRVLYRVVRDGVPMGWFDGPSLRLPMTEPGDYRLEVYRYSVRVGPFHWNFRPWLFTNPVHVRVADRQS